SGSCALEKSLRCPHRRRLAWRSRGGDFYPTNLTEIIIDIYPPPVASSPLDRGWHIALTPLRASAIRDYLDVRAMNGCPAKAVGSNAGDADQALRHGLAGSRESDKRRSSGAWAGSTRPRHPLSSLARNHLRAQTRQPGHGSDD